jgi:hypothetical protein
LTKWQPEFFGHFLTFKLIISLCVGKKMTRNCVFFS